MAIISSAQRKNNFTYIAFFDLDRTITSTVSGSVLAVGAFRKGLMSFSDVLNAIFLSAVYKTGLSAPEKIMEKMVRWVKGIPVTSFEELCIRTFNEVIFPSVHADAKKEIEMHRSQGARIVILSSSVIQVCREMAQKLSMDDIICSELETADGYLTGFSKGRLCYGDEKRRRLSEYCEKNNNTPGESWYYADSMSDFAALDLVGHPVCVNPEKKLLKTAKSKNWKVCRWE